MQDNHTEGTPLYTLNPLNRFSNRTEEYVKYRPSYPSETINITLGGLAAAPQLIVADIGAGTGIASRLLAEKGVHVIAVEPNAAMREAAESHPHVEFHNGSAEITNLPNASVDLVTCFQAFHWFNPNQSLLEFRRILKPSGRLSLVWNNRNKQDEFTKEYSQLVRAISNNHPGESRMKTVEPLLTSKYFANIREYNFIYRQELDLAGLIGRAMSVSYLPRKGEGYEKLIAGLESLYQRFCDRHNFVYMIYNTSVHLAELR
jgi:ubiquinone/menaquinone biosynthesis C-methylase UbiE